MKRYALIALLAVLAMAFTACAPATPQVIEVPKEVIVERPVIQTVVVEKQVAVEKQVVQTVVVEKPVVQTVVVEKEKEIVKTVVVEKVVEATPQPGGQMVWSRASPCEGGCTNPNLSGGGYVFHYAYNPAFLTSCDESGAKCNQPGLAYKWEESADHLTWTFYLRDDVRWSDGTPSTADDHIFTIHATTHPDFGDVQRQAMFVDVKGMKDYAAKTADKIAGIEKVDDYTFRIIFDVVKRRTPYEFSGYFLLPYHQLKDQTVAQWKDLGDKERITVGPYYFTDIVYEQYYAMKANPYFYLGKPHIDEFIYRAIPNWAVAISGLKSGEVDAVDVTPLNEVPGLREVATLNIIPDAVARGYMLWFNMHEGKALPKKVRQAMSLAIDRQAIIDTLWEGYGWTIPCQAQPQGVPLKGVIPDYNEYDPVLAKQLVEEAKAEGWNGKGWDGKKDIELGYYYTTEFTKQIMAAVADMWKEVGITAVPTFIPDDSWEPNVQRNAEYDIVYGCCADPGTLEHFQLDTLYTCACNFPSGWCFQGICDPEMDAIIEASGSFDRAVEVKAYQDFCVKLHGDLVSTLSMWMSPGLWTVNTRLRNTTAANGMFNKYLHTWWIEQ